MRALDVATKALARRDFSERGLRERLERAGVDPAEAEQVLARLRDEGANILASDFTLQQSGGTATAPSSVSVSGSQLGFTVAAASLSSTGLGAVTVRTSSTSGSNEIRHPTAVASGLQEEVAARVRVLP